MKVITKFNPMLHKDLKLNYRKSLVSEKQGSTFKNLKLKITLSRNRKKTKFFYPFYINII